MVRQIVIDTETTGMNQMGVHYENHKIIEIGAVEIVNRYLTGNNFHIYLKPNRLVDPEAFEIHGIADEFLLDKPIFSEIINEFLDYISHDELIIHNAPFDIGFINYEFSKINYSIPKIDTFCKITDSLVLAKKMFPGKRNSLDALCSRYRIDNKKRVMHSALFDAQILADIYLMMTNEQTFFSFGTENKNQKNNVEIQRIARRSNNLHIVLANDKELEAHESYLDLIQEKNNGNCLWRI